MLPLRLRSTLCSWYWRVMAKLPNKAFESATAQVDQLGSVVMKLLFDDGGSSGTNHHQVKFIVDCAKISSCVQILASGSISWVISRYYKQLLQGEDYVSNAVSLRGNDVFHTTYSSPALGNKVAEAVGIITEALDRYSLREICIGFNGGKDCTALLHLFYAVLCRKYPNTEENILSLYVRDLNPFEEVSQFIDESTHRYKLQLVTIDDKIKPALSKLKSQHPNVGAVLMGTRFTDPYSRNLTSFCPTDESWPKYMRINPLLKWSYHDIWEFLRMLCLPYCVLYDRGYTSLGSKDNTKRNEKLKFLNKNGVVRYKPAYTLQDEDFERNGRL